MHSPSTFLVPFLPSLWAADFLALEDDSHNIGEFNCSCLGVTGLLDASGKDMSACKPEDIERVQAMCDHFGDVAFKALENWKTRNLIDVSGLIKVATDDDGLMEQPAEPKYKVGLVECYNKNHAMGGSDKLTNTHRFDSIPLCKRMHQEGHVLPDYRVPP